jgi:hypothetical protein
MGPDAGRRHLSGRYPQGLCEQVAELDEHAGIEHGGHS